MNSMQDLINHGIDLFTADSMLTDYKARIGTMNGVYEIMDINYDFAERGRDVTLKCSLCRKVIHRMMINGRNKWPELIKSCECQKEVARVEAEKILKNKKALILSEIGKRYDDYEVIEVEFGKPDKLTVRCLTCGCEKQVMASVIVNGTWKGSKCHKHYVQPVKYDESYIGQKNNFLTVTGLTRNKRKEKRFICKCDCGKITHVNPNNWETGVVKSCGCMAVELMRKALKKENPLNSRRTYRIWKGMKQRCYNPRTDNYMDYGGRGICICSQWLDSYKEFEAWAFSHGYSNELSIDRINVNGNYEPSNCRWATDEIQMKNRRPIDEWIGHTGRKKVLWTINGVERPAREWCSQFGVSMETVTYRVKNKGMSLQEALSVPKMADGKPKKRCVNAYR